MNQEVVLDESRDCIGCENKNSVYFYLQSSYGGGARPWFIERSYRRWGAEPPVLPPLGGGYPPVKN